MATKLEIAQLLQLFENLPNNPAKDADADKVAQLVATYHATLHDLPLDMLKAAALGYLATGKFFPTPGDLRTKSVEIALLAMGVPTPGEAWGQIMTEGTVHAVRCDRARALAAGIETKTGGDYWAAVSDYSSHVDECPNCYDDTSRGWHQAVKATFDAMGGHSAIFTDNPAADRARFMDGYRTYVEREVLRLQLPAEVRGYIESSRTAGKLLQDQVKQLADGMRG